MSIKCCPRPSKVTHFRQSEKTDFHIYGLSSGITTHFQLKLFLSNGAANIKCVSQGSFTEKVEAFSLWAAPHKGAHHWKIPLCLLFPHGETNPLEQISFWLHGMHSSKLYCGATAQAPWKARSSSKAKCVLLDSVQLSSPGTQLCLSEHHTAQRFKTRSSNSKRHSIYLLIVANF